MEGKKREKQNDKNYFFDIKDEWRKMNQDERFFGLAV